MALGLSRKLNILQRSPLDANPPTPAAGDPDGAADREARHWVPSRYNVRARTEDGGLVVWNSLTGTLSAFPDSQRETVEAHLRRPGCVARREGLVEYLCDRGLLVERGTDEYRRMRLAFGQQHYRTDLLELILLASEDCNFRCTYCYEDFNRGTMEPWVRLAVQKLVTQRAPTLRRLQIRWFGGEPLYGWPAIEELAPFFADLAQRHPLRYGASMTTNGYLLTPDVAAKLLAWGVKAYQITLDGPAETHDRNRPRRDGEGSFDTILDNLRAMRRMDEPFLVDLRLNFDRGNRERMPDLLQQIEDDFGDDPRFRLHFHPVGRWGGANDDQLDVCGTQESEQIVQDLKDEAARRGLKLAGNPRALPKLGGKVCYAARPYNFIVGAAGDLMKCTVDLDKKDRNLVGRLTPEGGMVLDPDRFGLWTEPVFENDSKCQKCVVLPVCQGMHCPQIRYDEDRSPCTALRHGAKQQLRTAYAAGKESSHKATVEAREAPRPEVAASSSAP